MEPKQVMENSIKILLHDVDRVSAIVADVQRGLQSPDCQALGRGKVAQLIKQLKEASARLEGIRDFASACQSRVNKKATESDNIEMWV